MKKKETLDLQGFSLVAETRDLCKLTRIELRPVAVPDSDFANGFARHRRPLPLTRLAASAPPAALGSFPSGNPSVAV